MSDEKQSVPECVKFHLFLQYVRDHFVGHRILQIYTKTKENERAQAAFNSITKTDDLFTLRDVSGGCGKMFFSILAKNEKRKYILITKSSKLDWLVDSCEQSKLFIDFNTSTLKHNHTLLSYHGDMNTLECGSAASAHRSDMQLNVFENYLVDPITTISEQHCLDKIKRKKYFQNGNSIFFNIIKKTFFGISDQDIIKALAQHGISQTTPVGKLSEMDFICGIKQILINCTMQYYKLGGRGVNSFCPYCRREYTQVVQDGPANATEAGIVVT